MENNKRWFSLGWLIVLLIIFWPAALVYIFVKWYDFSENGH